MSIEIASLKKMIVLEAKASIAWKALSSVEQSAYITANPGSKFKALADVVKMHPKSGGNLEHDTHKAIEGAGYHHQATAEDKGGRVHTFTNAIKSPPDPKKLHKGLTALGYSRNGTTSNYKHPAGHRVETKHVGGQHYAMHEITK